MKRIKYSLICCLTAAIVGLCACGNGNNTGTTTTTSPPATTGTTGTTGNTGTTSGTTGTTGSKVQTNIGNVLRGYGTGAGNTGYYEDYTYGSLFRNGNTNSRVLDNLGNRASYTRYYYDSLGNIYTYDANAGRAYVPMPYNSSAIMPEINAQ